MAFTFPRIPDPPVRDPDVPIALYGQRLIVWLLGPGTCTTLDMVQLELVQHALTGLAGAPMVDRARERLTELSREVSERLAYRTRLERQTGTGPAGGTTPDRPNLGPMARLQDAPIVQPPSGTYATVGRPVVKPEIAF